MANEQSTSTNWGSCTTPSISACQLTQQEAMMPPSLGKMAQKRESKTFRTNWKQGRRNRSGQSGHGLTSFWQLSFNKVCIKKPIKGAQTGKCAYLCLDLILFILYLSIHNSVTRSLAFPWVMAGSRDAPKQTGYFRSPMWGKYYHYDVYN